MITENLDRALVGFSTTPGKPERDHLVKCIKDLVRFEIERQPLQMLQITGEGTVTGPLAPAIIKIASDVAADAINQYDAMRQARSQAFRVISPEEQANSDKVLSRIREALADIPDGKGYSCSPDEPQVVEEITLEGDTASGTVTLDPGDKWSFTQKDGTVVNGVVPGKLYDEYNRIGEAFDRVVEAQREDANREYDETHKAPAVVRCQHDLTKPVATRHVIRHTDEGIITKCHACGEFRSYKLQEVD